MAASRRRGPTNKTSASEEDDADIVARVGAEPDEESGDLLAEADRVRELGAVDVDSARENARLAKVVGRKRAGEKDVHFNAGDILTKFEYILKMWPANTINISMKRLTGTQVQYVIATHPKSGPELYDELMKRHGLHEEAQYEVKIIDSSNSEFRGMGRVTLPDTRPPQQGQGQQPMTTPPYPGYGYPPPPYAPNAQQSPWYPQQPGGAYPQQPPFVGSAPQPAPHQAAPPAPEAPQPAASAPQAPPPPPPPQVHVVPPPQVPDPMQMMHQMWGLFSEMQASMMQRQQQSTPMAPQTQTPSPPQMPPPPPPHADPSVMMDWMRQMWGMLQSMQPPTQSGGQPQPQPSPQQNPMAGMAAAVPPVTPPPGMMWVPGFGFVPVERLVRAVSDESPRPSRSPFRPSRHFDDVDRPPPYAPPAPPPRPQSPTEGFREALQVMQGAVEAVNQLNSLVPKPALVPAPAPIVAAPSDDDDDDSPVRVMETGQGRVIFDKQNGKIRGWETLLANSGDILKWVADQRESMQRPQERRQLPEGHIEVPEGQPPPPGYERVEAPPVQQPARQAQTAPQGSGLPPPPANMPPPIASTPPSGRSWEMPPIR